ncbi:tRNA pseudouridine(38-40) synthase TruA [uncultured Cyclobacterium sp.]|uniref:tRNA pseudouridine(38-40) synthase TruA n=1 Tax=uncultured Cyclobacterium sp. TaxID=453820 RepID=UPI0030EDF5E7|tara:strand:- start:15896 stop:16687 length:792 start_codon:yes stop_codon:yes gene_type:complete
MQTKPFKYVFRLQYLGIRYHGWQVQKGLKTIQGTLERTFRYVLQHEDFNILGSSRTDTGVSCLHGAFELFLPQPINPEDYISTLNENLPSDIKILSGKQSTYAFNIIQDVTNKSYGYYFAIGEKPHPMFAGSVAYAGLEVDLKIMQEGATILEGKHDFRRFCTHSKNTDDFVRNITQSKIEKPPEDHAFLPKNDVMVFRVVGDGFLMHQVRRMAAALLLLGKGEIRLSEIQDALESPLKIPLCGKAPANGLVLENISFTNDSF